MARSSNARSSNGKAKLPRLVPGAPNKAPQRHEVDLPGVGASVVIQPPTVASYLAIQAQNLSDEQESVALAGVSIVEPEMTAEQFSEAVATWPLSDWFMLQQVVMSTLGLNKEALRDAQDEFRGSDQ